MFFLSVLLVVVSSYLILSGITGKSSNSGNYEFSINKGNAPGIMECRILFLTGDKLGKFSGGSYVSAFNVRPRNDDGFLYFLLIAFSQIVLSFEILSLFKAISKNGFLICNIVFFIVSLVVFFLCSKNMPSLRGAAAFCATKQSIKNRVFKDIIQALKRDKALMFLSVCFIFFLIFQLITNFFLYVPFGDADGYYFPRCTAWIQNGSISHYITPDTRELVMPVNMEFLYTWMFLFLKTDRGSGIFSFISFLGLIYIIFNLLRELKFSVRRSLWAVFVVSSFALLVVEMIVPCGDLFIGALILGSIYLFLKGLKTNNKQAVFFSALSYALAVGTKTTAIIAIPSVFIIFCTITYIYGRQWKQLWNFCKLFILCFIIFSSYNYILNIIQFHNPVTCKEQMLLNQFNDGIQGYLANLIKYCLAIFDMSGMPEFININGMVEYWQSSLLSAIGAKNYTGATNYFPFVFKYNNKMGMVESALGAIGLFAFLPSVIYSIKRWIKNKSKTACIMGILAFSIIFNVLLFSRVMVFTGFNMRYILTFVIIASPVAAYSYPAVKHKLCKIFLCLIMFIYFIVYAHHGPTAYIIACIKAKKIVLLYQLDEETKIREYIREKKPSNIALITTQTANPTFRIERLRLEGFHIDKILLEDIENYKLEKYDYIISRKEKTASTNIVNFKERIKYPKLFVTKCEYLDYNQYEIDHYEKGLEPAFVQCEVPYKYLELKGFIKDEIYKGNDYVILKKE